MSQQESLEKSWRTVLWTTDNMETSRKEVTVDLAAGTSQKKTTSTGRLYKVQGKL